MKPLLIFPCNGNGREALDCLGDEFECIGFVDDAPEKQGHLEHGIPVFGRSAFVDYPDALILAVPGSPESFHERANLIHSLGIPHNRFARVIHPHAAVSAYSKVGYNTLIMSGVVITSNAMIGDHVCILPNSVIHHDSVIGKWSLIGSGVVVAGGTIIGENCYVGSGSTIRNNISVGDRSLIGLGSNVVKDVPAVSVIAGNPAKPFLKRNGK